MFDMQSIYNKGNILKSTSTNILIVYKHDKYMSHFFFFTFADMNINPLPGSREIL